MVGIYTRQSKEKKDSVSIESQIDKCIALCTYNDWEYKIYKDVGFSGKDLKRPSFTKLMDDLRSGEIKKVICYRLDRISRSMADFSQLILTFEEHGCDFASATENFDTSTPLGRAMVNIIMTFAQLERETITERVTDNYYFRGNKGYWAGGPAPYGYKLTKEIFDGKMQSVLKIDPNEAKIVKMFYDWYLEFDGSARKIITKANELGVKTRKGSMWTSRVIVDLLWKPLYTSNTAKIYNYFKTKEANIINDISEFDGTKAVNLYGKTNKKAGKHKRCRDINEQYLIVSQHQPLIDDEQWVKVQNKKGFKSQIPPRTGQSQNSYLTGLMSCKYCDYSVSVLNCKHKYKDSYYVNKYYACSTRKNRGKDICELPLIPAEKIEKEVLEKMIKHYNSSKVQKLLNIDVKEKVSNRYSVEKNDFEINLIKNNEEIANLITGLATGSTALTKYIEQRIDILEEEKNKIEKGMQQLEVEEFGEMVKFDNLEYILDCAKDLKNKIEKADFDQMKYMCNTLIKKITVSTTDVAVTFTI